MRKPDHTLVLEITSKQSFAFCGISIIFYSSDLPVVEQMVARYITAASFIVSFIFISLAVLPIIESHNIQTSCSMSYSYSPQQLLQSYHALKLEAASAPNDPPQTSSSPVTPRTGTSFRVAAIQISSAGFPHSDVHEFWAMAQQAVEKAASQGNHLILLPELFIGPYFCQSQEACLMGLADPISEDHFIVRRMKQLAAQYQVVLPISLYERKNNVLYNSVVMIDADGSLLGTYREYHWWKDWGWVRSDKLLFGCGTHKEVLFLSKSCWHYYNIGKSHIPDGTGKNGLLGGWQSYNLKKMCY
jgi:Carbon-nitrogen hydrolase